MTRADAREEVDEPLSRMETVLAWALAIAVVALFGSRTHSGLLGEPANLVFYGSMLAISLVALLVIVLRSKRRRRRLASSDRGSDG